jgi:hypothetical protein
MLRRLSFSGPSIHPDNHLEFHAKRSANDGLALRDASCLERHALQAIYHLRVHRMLNPERAILVKGGNAILGCDILGIRLVVGHLLEESQDSLFGEHVLLECFELNGVNAVLEPRLGLRLPRRFADKPDE